MVGAQVWLPHTSDYLVPTSLLLSSLIGELFEIPLASSGHSVSPFPQMMLHCSPYDAFDDFLFFFHINLLQSSVLFSFIEITSLPHRYDASLLTDTIRFGTLSRTLRLCGRGQQAPLQQPVVHMSWLVHRLATSGAVATTRSSGSRRCSRMDHKVFRVVSLSPHHAQE
jgi:hypothetical protein